MPSEHPPTFAQWLSVSMDNHGMSGKKLGALIGADGSAVSLWKNGKVIPSPPNINKIARIFGVPGPRLMATADPEQYGDWGDPLPVPPRLALRKRIRKHLSGTFPDIDAAELRDIEAVLAAADAARASLGSDTEIIKALEVIRSHVSGGETA